MYTSNWFECQRTSGCIQFIWWNAKFVRKVKFYQPIRIYQPLILHVPKVHFLVKIWLHPSWRKWSRLSVCAIPWILGQSGNLGQLRLTCRGSWWHFLGLVQLRIVFSTAIIGYDMILGLIWHFRSIAIDLKWYQMTLFDKSAFDKVDQEVDFRLLEDFWINLALKVNCNWLPCSDEGSVQAGGSPAPVEWFYTRSNWNGLMV